MSAGHRHIWFDRNNPLVTYLDRRSEVKPTIVCDTRDIPLRDNCYDLVVFDPPHANVGANSKFTPVYGHSTTADILDTVRGSAREAWRVTKSSALMAFKWNDNARTLEEILPLLEGWTPLFAHGLRKPGRHKTQTYWVMLKRKPANRKADASE